MEQTSIDSHRVVIYCEGKEITIQNPKVTKKNDGSREWYEVEASENTPSTINETDSVMSDKIEEKDIEILMEIGHVGREAAEKAIKEAHGDVSKALFNLKN